MNEDEQRHLADAWGNMFVPAAMPAAALPPYSKGDPGLTNGVNLSMEAANQNHGDVSRANESDAEDEEVRNLDLPAQVGIDLRNKSDRQSGTGGGGDNRERPMSWEGELSDQEVQEDSTHLLKTEPTNEDEETAMEVGPSSPQPVYIAAPEPPTTAVSVKSERLWENAVPPPVAKNFPPEAAEQQRLRRSPPLTITQRPPFEALTGHTPLASPLTSRHPIRLPLSASGLPHPPTPSPDSAIHSAYYSPTASPGQSRHRNGSGLSSPYSHRASPSLSRNNSDASQYSQFGGSQYSYSSAPSPLSPSPAQSPVQPRHMAMLAAAGGYPRPPTGPHGLGALGEFPPSPLLYRHGHIPQFPVATPAGSLPGVRDLEIKTESTGGLSAPSIDSIEDSTRDALEDKALNPADLAQHTALAAQAGISRQQLINSPCPICGDKISGFHYGIFSCESCKGFFKRTVQNKKNYVCLRGAACPVTIATRKKCPACRFEKCLNTGMKLEAIREDRTRGGRSTYQCTYALPAGVLSTGPEGPKSLTGVLANEGSSSRSMDSDWSNHATSSSQSEERAAIPQLLLEIMNVEHFWHNTEQQHQHHHHHHRKQQQHFHRTPFQNGEDLSSVFSIADDRLYKIVKWCKSLPLFKSIHIDDQISLLINTWCELLLLACCYRSMATPGVIRISQGKAINVDQSRALGLGPCIERMVNFTDHLRRLRVDQYEYAALKVIILLSSDTSGLKEPESVRASQESVLKALQQYTLSHYPDIPSKFGELLLRIPELERTCQVAKEMLTMKQEGDGQGFNLLMELLSGDH